MQIETFGSCLSFAAMNGTKLLGHVIILVSTLIFLYQSWTAILKLTSEETIIISEVKDITDPRVELPLITVCRVNQYPVAQPIKVLLKFMESDSLHLGFLLYRLYFSRIF